MASDTRDNWPEGPNHAHTTTYGANARTAVIRFFPGPTIVVFCFLSICSGIVAPAASSPTNRPTDRHRLVWLQYFCQILKRVSHSGCSASTLCRFFLFFFFFLFVCIKHKKITYKSEKKYPCTTSATVFFRVKKNKHNTFPIVVAARSLLVSWNSW